MTLQDANVTTFGPIMLQDPGLAQPRQAVLTGRGWRLAAG